MILTHEYMPDGYVKVQAVGKCNSTHDIFFTIAISPVLGLDAAMEYLAVRNKQ